MIVPQEQVERGLQMLGERRQLLGWPDQITNRDRDRAARQIERAQAPWNQTRDLLAGHADVLQILCDLWPKTIPYLIKGNEVSPIHHIAYVVSFMARICLRELALEDFKPGLIASLLHDIGIGDCLLPKISEASIERASGDEKLRLRRDGIESRLEHMKKGVQISREMLTRYQHENPSSLSDNNIETILEIVASHDFSKIPLMEDHVDRKWLLSSDRKDWLKQCHWEADALWMLCPAGILVDLEREHEPDTAANRRAKFEFNLGLHRQIVSLYAKAYSPEEMSWFGFHDGLLYRSETGYQIAMEFREFALNPASEFYSQA